MSGMGGAFANEEILQFLQELLPEKDYHPLEWFPEEIKDDIRKEREKKRIEKFQAMKPWRR